MADFDYEAINPGVRRLVRFLREHGFETCDSGDGVTREFECDPGFPYVHMRVNAGDMVDLSVRLHNLLLPFVDFHPECKTEDEQMAAPMIEASFSPVDLIATLSIFNVTDTNLPN